MKSILHKFFVRPPVIFPLVAFFLLFLFINEASLSLFSKEVEPLYKLRSILMLLMTVFWIGTTFFKKWAALSFVILSILSLIAFFYSNTLAIQSLFGNLLILNLPIEEGRAVPIPLSAIFSFIALFFYKKMD